MNVSSFDIPEYYVVREALVERDDSVPNECKRTVSNLCVDVCALASAEFKVLLAFVEGLMRTSHKFFKCIKQNIVVKTLWGYSENDIGTHLWVVIIAYLVTAKVKADYYSPYSITEMATLIRILELERADLRDLITKPKDSIIQAKMSKNLLCLTIF